MRVFGKLNLFLNVGEALGGFHALESVFASCHDIYDDVFVSRCDKADAGVFFSVAEFVSKGSSCEYLGNYSDGVSRLSGVEDNTAKAVRLFCEKFGAMDLRVEVKKGIPFLAGMGGSSADAVGVLKCLCEMTGKSYADVSDICDMIGSDLAGMWLGGVSFCEGRGDIASVVCSELGGFAVVCVPMFGVSTREVFAEFDSLDGVKPWFDYRGGEDFICEFPRLCNGLQGSAFAVSSELAEFADRLFAASGVEFHMTGSGSGMFCLVRDRETAERICESVKGVCGFCGVTRV